MCVCLPSFSLVDSSVPDLASSPEPSTVQTEPARTRPGESRGAFLSEKESQALPLYNILQSAPTPPSRHYEGSIHFPGSFSHALPLKLQGPFTGLIPS